MSETRGRKRVGWSAASNGADGAGSRASRDNFDWASLERNRLNGSVIRHRVEATPLASCVRCNDLFTVDVLPGDRLAGNRTQRSGNGTAEWTHARCGGRLRLWRG